MWQALKDIANSVKESLGIEVPAVPDPAAVTQAAAGAAGQAGEAVTTAASAVTGAAGDAAAGVGEQISSKVSDFLGRFGG